MINPYKEGYIGITNKSINERLLGHKKAYSKCSIVKKAIEKYNDIEIIELHNTTKIDALKLEEKYRPSEKIGWNICKGGGYPPRPSEKTKAKISATIKKLGVIPYDKNKTHSPEALAKATAKRIGRKRIHNPLTGVQKMVNPNNIPEGWILGSYNINA